MKRWIVIVATLWFATHVSACFSTRDFTQEELRAERNHDITVQTKDGRTIIYHEGEYKITDADGGSIEGKGRLLVNKSKNEYRDLESAVAFTEIRTINDTEMTLVGKIGLATTLSITVILGLFLIALGRSGSWH